MIVLLPVCLMFVLFLLVAFVLLPKHLDMGHRFGSRRLHQKFVNPSNESSYVMFLFVVGDVAIWSWPTSTSKGMLLLLIGRVENIKLPWPP